jgi:hypothetical protein
MEGGRIVRQDVVSEMPWMSRTPWGAIIAGALAGFAALVIMGTLGSALGFTASAVALANTEGPVREAAEKAAMPFGIGAVVWILLTAIVTGLVGGWALNRTARIERSYFAFTFGVLTWATGLFLALLVVVPGWSGMMAGLGGTMAPRAGMEMSRERGMLERGAAPREPGMERQQPAIPEPSKPDAEKAANIATAMAWVMLASQIISLASTILAASWRRPTRPRIQTEIRLRPAPTA